MRRVTGGTSTPQTIFGIGISPSSGYVALQKGNLIATNSSQPQQPQYQNGTWQTLYVGCYEQWLPVTLCLFFDENDRSNRYHLQFEFFNSSTAYTENANGVNDTLWLGSSSPESAPTTTAAANCGRVSIASLSINQGHIPYFVRILFRCN
jgi:hypothetical protein